MHAGVRLARAAGVGAALHACYGPRARRVNSNPHLCEQVFVWRAPQARERHRAFFTDPGHWPTKRAAVSRASREPAFPLALAMDAMLDGNAEHDKVMAEVAEAQTKLTAAKDRSINVRTPSLLSCTNQVRDCSVGLQWLCFHAMAQSQVTAWTGQRARARRLALTGPAD